MGGYATLKKHTEYTAERSIIISHTYKAETADQQVQADLNLAKTYTEMVNSADVANVARKQLPNKMKRVLSVDDIKQMIDVKPVDQSLVLKISATSDDPKTSTKVVNAVAEAAAVKIPRMSPVAGNVSLFSPAKVANAESKTTPSTKKYALLGMALGMLIGVVVAFSITTWKHLI